jgi:hypothetical protein
MIINAMHNMIKRIIVHVISSMMVREVSKEESNRHHKKEEINRPW